MTEPQLRYVELLFIAFIQNLFEKTHNPVNAMAWLKVTCSLLCLEPETMQRLVLDVMSRHESLCRVSDELAYLLFSTNQSVDGIIKLAARSRASVYRRIKKYGTEGYAPIKLHFTEPDARYAAEFLRAFRTIGGILS